MQHDYVISNDTGANVRADINNVLQAILTNNSGATQPSTTQAGMLWGDISNASTYYLKIRNHTNDGWGSLYAYDVATKTISPVNTPAGNISSTTVQGAINELDTEKQATLVSGTNIKTVNSTSLLGSGDVAVQESLVSGTNIKSINNSSILASGNLDLVSKVSSTDNAIVRFDGTSGAVQNSSVVIDDSGNVGIGVTPSAWGSGYKNIEISNVSSFGDYSSGGYYLTQVRNNAYDNSGWKYKQNAYASLYMQDSGKHTWKTASSGTAGNAITWNIAMTLGSNGNLLVGTTTDNGVDKLQVNGKISASNLLAGIIIGDLGSNVSLNVNDTIFIEARNGSGQKCFPIIVASDNGSVDTYHSALFKVEVYYGGGTYYTLSNSVQKNIIGYYSNIYYTNIQFRDEFFSHHQIRGFRITYLGNGSGSGVLTVKATGFGLYL